MKILKERCLLKRLSYYMRGMENSTTTYKEIYEGGMSLAVIPPEGAFEAKYWREDVSYEISRTHKLALDKPTITIGIPLDQLNFTDTSDAAADFCLRSFIPYITELNDLNYNRSRPDKENGKYYIYEPNGKILKRNCSFFSMSIPKWYVNLGGNSVRPIYEETTMKPYLNIMIQLQFPFKKIKKSITMLTKDLPEAVDNFILNFNTAKLHETLELADKQRKIREWLKSSDYCVFMANGSILPRDKGTDNPLTTAVPFKSTPEDEIEIAGVKGMGIKKGVTIITGGGYSGKSTVLDAVSSGIYDHILGDGRELVITDDTAMKISAEDGRSVKNVNISPFIKWLPNGDTTEFSTDHASGSTSQAANIIEAVNINSKLLLIDEDKSATNFMIRDKLMKELIDKEPIIPLTDRVQELHHKMGVSTIIVIGGSGEYLSVTDRIYMMEDFKILNASEKSKSLCGKYGISAEIIPETEWAYKTARKLATEGFTPYPADSGTELLSISELGFILIGDERIDIRMLHNVTSQYQLNAIGFIIRKLMIENKELFSDAENKITAVLNEISEENLEIIFTSFFTTCERWLELPRINEIMAVINRMRRVRFV